MRKTVFMSALALALAVSGTAFAQATTGAASPPPPTAAKPQKANPQPALTIEKLTQDLKKAGFSEVKVLEDAFLVQAKTKDGNPILMTIGPHGMSALEVSMPSPANQDRTVQAHPDNSPASVPAKPAQK